VYDLSYSLNLPLSPPPIYDPSLRALSPRFSPSWLIAIFSQPSLLSKETDGGEKSLGTYFMRFRPTIASQMSALKEAMFPTISIQQQTLTPRKRILSKLE
jgi:hypothetical protein